MKIKSSEKLPLGEYGRQRTSKKFHDLVLSLRSQNSRVPETTLFQALFSQRKVFNFLKWLKSKSHFLKIVKLFYVTQWLVNIQKSLTNDEGFLL